MKRTVLLILIAFSSLSSTAWAGDVQVLCQPGLRVYLDDELVGTSNEKEDGLFLMDVAPGKRTIRVEKDGCVPQNFRVEVRDLGLGPGKPEARTARMRPAGHRRSRRDDWGGAWDFSSFGAPRRCRARSDDDDADYADLKRDSGTPGGIRTPAPQVGGTSRA